MKMDDYKCYHIQACMGVRDIHANKRRTCYYIIYEKNSGSLKICLEPEAQV